MSEHNRFYGSVPFPAGWTLEPTSLRVSMIQGVPNIVFGWMPVDPLRSWETPVLYNNTMAPCIYVPTGAVPPFIGPTNVSITTGLLQDVTTGMLIDTTTLTATTPTSTVTFIAGVPASSAMPPMYVMASSGQNFQNFMNTPSQGATTHGAVYYSCNEDTASQITPPMSIEVETTPVIGRSRPQRLFIRRGVPIQHPSCHPQAHLDCWLRIRHQL
jgi:hypothetical protein